MVVPKRSDITNEIIIDLYFNKGLNCRQTAEKLKCSEDLIAYRLKKLGLDPKPMAECVFAGKKRSVAIPQELVEILNGELLGDGSLNRYYKQGDFRESFGHNKREWAEYLMGVFLNNNIPIMGQGLYKRNPCGKSKNITWSFSTLNTIELGRLHKKWYIRNNNFDSIKPASFNNRRYIKMVPIDLKLTAKAMLHWYIGDGSVNDGKGCFLYTQGFGREEIEFLRFRLKKDLNIGSAYYLPDVIGIPKRERVKLLEIIGECPVGCYEYKWNVYAPKTKRTRAYNHHINTRMIENYIDWRGSI